MRLTTSKKVAEIKLEASSALSPAAVAAELLKKVAATEKAYQEELNRGFGRLSEGTFKGLRRQLPVTRQKVEWEKIGGYRVSFLSSFSFLSFPPLFYAFLSSWGGVGMVWDVCMC